jgi:hypothetical protein
MEVSGQCHAPAALPLERPDTKCMGGWVDLRPVWTCAENLVPTGIQSPDRPASSELLYRLSYLDPSFHMFEKFSHFILTSSMYYEILAKLASQN